MTKLKKLGLGVVLTTAMCGVSTGALAAGWGDSDDKGDWGGGHHKMEKQEKKSDWSKGSWGMSEGEGHMTMRMRMVWNLDLSAKQRKAIRTIQRDSRSKALAIDDKIEDVSDELFGLYKSDKRDAKAIGKVYGKIFELRREKIELMIDTGNKVEAELSGEQRGQLKKFRMNPRWGAMH